MNRFDTLARKFLASEQRALCWICCLLAAVGLLAVNGALSAQNSGVAQDTLSIRADSISAPPTAPALVYTLNIEGAIGAVTAKRISEAVELAEADGAGALLITLDTPGGFSNATRTINKAILNSHVPVIVYIAPAGARGGSAGVYITYAAHVAVMAPGTNIGAAHPVDASGKDIDSIMNEKVTNDAVASLRAMAEKRGRNAEWAERSVRESVSITDREADSLNVIDFRAESRDELYAKADGLTVETPAGDVTLHLKNVREVELEESFIESVLRIISSPDIAFALLAIGALGIMLELYHPGAIFPGVVGGISIILAAYSLQMLPINTSGILLIVLSLILFILESQIPSYGLLTVGGIISLALGGLMLIDTYDPALQVSASIVWTIAITIGVIMALVVYLVARSYKRQVATGAEGMIGASGVVRKDLAPEGMALVAGELWKARSLDGATIPAGEEVIVDHVDNIYLVVKRKSAGTHISGG